MQQPGQDRFGTSGLFAAGVGLGLGASRVLTRHLGTRLFDVRASEPAILAAVTAVLMGVALLACDIPARRAGRVGASVALRGE